METDLKLALEDVINYLSQQEKAHYEAHLAYGGAAEEHIYHSIQVVKKWFEENK
jgi:hypothetical protein